MSIPPKNSHLLLFGTATITFPFGPTTSLVPRALARFRPAAPRTRAWIVVAAACALGDAFPPPIRRTRGRAFKARSRAAWFPREPLMTLRANELASAWVGLVNVLMFRYWSLRNSSAISIIANSRSSVRRIWFMTMGEMFGREGVYGECEFVDRGILLYTHKAFGRVK